MVFDRKAYTKKYRQKHKEELQRKRQIYKKNNKEKIRSYQKKYRGKNKAKFKIYQQKYKQTYDGKLIKKIWLQKNPEKDKQYKENYKNKHPERIKAQLYAQKHKQKGTECVFCKETKDLHFHHTDYESNEGITVCRRCHLDIHESIKARFIQRGLRSA